MTRSDRISRNAGRLVAGTRIMDFTASQSRTNEEWTINRAVTVAQSIEDAVDKAERERKGLSPKEVA